MADKTELNLARIRACDEEIWRTIRGAKVLIDAGSGEIKGGAGGKLNGQKFKPSFGRSLKTGKKVLLPSIHTKFSHHKGSKAELLQRLKKSVEPPKTKTKAEVGKAYRDVYYTGFYGAKTIDDLDKMKEESDNKIKEFESIFKQLDRSTLVKDPNLSYDFAYRVLSGDNVVENLKQSVQNDYDYAKKSILREEATTKAKAAWTKVVKYKTAMNAAKTLAGKQTNQQRLKDAYDAYKAEVAKAPNGRVNFKPKTSSVDTLLNKTPDQLKSEINDLTNQRANGNMAPNQAGKSITKPNFTLDTATKTSHMHMVNLLHAMGARGSNLSDDQLAKTIKSKMADIMQKSYPSVPMSTFKNSSTDDIVKRLYTSTRRMQKNPLLNNHPLQQITAGMGLDKPPTVLSEADFNAYVKKNRLPVMYRSVGHGPRKNSYGLGGKNKTDGFRYDDNAWTGEGIYGDGHYFAQDWNESRGYGDYTVKAAIDPSKVKAFDYRRDLNKVPYDVRHDTQLLPIWCLQHGYNVIYIKGGNYQSKGHDFWSVLDRSCLVVSEEDCNDHP